MRRFWSVTCISLGRWWHCSICNFKWCLIYVSAFIFISACVWCVCIYMHLCAACVVYIKVWICPLSRQSQPRHALISHYWVSFFFSFFYFDVYLQAVIHGLSYCMFTFHLFMVNTGKRGGRGAKTKMHTDVFRDSQAEWLLFLAMLHTLATKKKVQLFWHQCFGHKISTLLFFCLFSRLFSFAHLFLK